MNNTNEPKYAEETAKRLKHLQDAEDLAMSRNPYLFDETAFNTYCRDKYSPPSLLARVLTNLAGYLISVNVFFFFMKLITRLSEYLVSLNDSLFLGILVSLGAIILSLLAMKVSIMIAAFIGIPYFFYYYAAIAAAITFCLLYLIGAFLIVASGESGTLNTVNFAAGLCGFNFARSMLKQSKQMLSAAKYWESKQ